MKKFIYPTKGMIYPSFAELVEKASNRYMLVIGAAKRARQLTAGSIHRVDTDSDKPVSIAVDEISAGKVIIRKKTATEITENEEKQTADEIQ